MSPVFRILKRLQKVTTAKDDVAVGLREDIEKLFAVKLRACGLNLDGNPRKKKKALIDFLLCLPEMLESAAMKKKHIQQAFVESGMIDDETKMVPTFEGLMSTCKRWGCQRRRILVYRRLSRIIVEASFSR